MPWISTYLKEWLPGSGCSVVPILHVSNASVNLNLAAEFIQLNKLAKQKKSTQLCFNIYM